MTAARSARGALLTYWIIDNGITIPIHAPVSIIIYIIGGK